MSVRKRSWVTRLGVAKEAWIVDYVDQQGVRHIKTFDRKKEADAYAGQTSVDVRTGTHTPDSKSISIRQAGERWIAAGEADALQRATLVDYRRHLDLHIAPYVGEVRLSRLTAPMVADFQAKLRNGTPAPGQETGTKRSPAMIKKIVASLGSIMAQAQADSLVAQNVVRAARKRRRTKAEQRRKLKAGVDFPTPIEIRALVSKLEGRWRPLLLTAIFTGLRASELRGLRWSDVDLRKGEIHVHQRADRYNQIDAPKSEAGERTVPLPPLVLSTLREWKLACPKGELGLAFPNGAGQIEAHGNIINRGLVPTQIAAGVITPVLDTYGKPQRNEEGAPIVAAKYTGLHALRHFYASWCINRKEDGGLGLPAKVVQERLGHSSIMMTMDVYGHLFPRGDHGTELADAERALLG